MFGERLYVTATLVSSLLSCCSAEPQRPTPSPKRSGRPETRPAPASRSPFRNFAVYALSRAKGVPPEAREALRKVREFIEGDRSRGLGVRVETERIGIEGETRVCAEYEDPEDAGRAFERASALVKGIDLINLAIEPCDQLAAPGERKKGEARQ